MRSIIVIAILVFLFGCKATNTTAQPTAYNRYLSLSVTPVDAFLKVRYAFSLPSVSDTVLNGGLDSLGSMIQVKSGANAGLWRRDSNIVSGGHLWTKLADKKEIHWQLNGSDLSPVDLSYMVGIGTASPTHPLDIIETDTTENPMMVVKNFSRKGKAQLLIRNDTTDSHGLALTAFGTGYAANPQLNDIGMLSTSHNNMVITTDGSAHNGENHTVSLRIGGYDADQERARFTKLGVSFYRNNPNSPDSGGFAPTAKVHIAGGRDTTGGASLKIDTATGLLSTLEEGAIERTSQHFYITLLDSVGDPARFQLDQQSGPGSGGAGPYTFNSPLHESGMVVTIDNAVADGSTKGAATFNANDFNSSSGLITIDYANGQAASGSVKGFLSSTDWTTFNNKSAPITGTASSIATASITANRVMITDGTQKAAASRIDTTHLGFLGSATSDIQVQLNTKLTSTLSSAQVFVGNASNVATARALTGVLAITNTGVTSLANSGVSAGSYSNANIVVGADGRVTSASNGSAASVSSVFGRTGAVVAVSGDYTTSLVTEGSNLYYTTTRFNTALATKTTTDLAEGSNLYYTDVRADARITAQKGVANGIADLDAGGHVPVAELPAGAQTYKGTWNANTNTPTLVDGTGTAGWTYRVTVAGTQNLGSGSIVWAVGDDAIYDGTIWQRNPAGTGAVSSVNGFTGAVVLTTTNIAEGTNTYFSGKTTTDLPEGSSLYFTNSRARSALSAGTGVSFSTSTGVISLPASGVTATTYTNATVTVNAQGILTAASNGSSSSVTMVSGTSPIQVANPITTPVISILNAAADGSTKGAAWFNSNDFNDNGSGGISLDYTNGQSAGTSTKGYLTSTDWNTFNNKVPTTRTITAGTGLTGGGDLSANRTITLNTISGFITAGSNVTITGSGTIASPFSIASSVTGGGGVSSFAFTNGSGFTGTVTNATTTPALSLVLQNAAADGSTRGQATFNANQFNATTGVITLDTTNGPRSSASTIGYLSSTDWSLFNGKQPAATGAVTTVMNANLTALRVAVSNGAGKLIASTIDTTHLGYLAHANADLQDQIDAIVTTTGTVIQNTFITLTDAATISWTYSSGGTKRPHAQVTLSGAGHRIAISGDAEGESGVIRVVQPASGTTFYDIRVPVGDLIQDGANLGASADTIDLPEGVGAVAMLNYIKLPAGNRTWFYAYVHN